MGGNFSKSCPGVDLHVS